MEQPNIDTLRNTLQLMSEQSTVLAHQFRTLLTEYGFGISVETLRLQQQYPEVTESVANNLSVSIPAARAASTAKLCKTSCWEPWSVASAAVFQHAGGVADG